MAKEFDNTSENGTSSVTLMEGITTAQRALHLFLENNFKEAEDICRSHIYESMYHAVTYSTMLHIQAAATLESAHLKAAMENMLNALNVCQRLRRKIPISNRFVRLSMEQKTSIYAQYTDEEAHAELCYAESLLQYVFLKILQDEKLSTLVKGSLKLRECYRCYKTCWNIYKIKEWGASETRASFECGVMMGVGAFNLLLSLLPSKVLSWLKFVSLTGKQEIGLRLLRQGSKIQNGVRNSLCCLIVLVYDLYAIEMVSEDEKSALLEARILLNEWSNHAPESAILLFLRGRLELISGNFEECQNCLFASIKSQSQFLNYHHMSYWELMWCYCIQRKWLYAMKYAERQACESKWSNSTFCYLKGTFLLQFLDEEARAGDDCAIENNTDDTLLLQYYQNKVEIIRKTGKPSAKQADRNVNNDADGGAMADHLERLMESVPQIIHRVAGKSIPIEKFALRKAKRFFEQGKRLALPGLEMMYIWNGFKFISNHPEILEDLLDCIEYKLHKLLADEVCYQYFYDNYCLAVLLRGVCLKYLQKVSEACLCFEEVISNEANLQMDKYLIPFSEVELCQISLKNEDFVDAEIHLNRALTYKNYSLEARLNFRLQALTTLIKSPRPINANNQLVDLNTMMDEYLDLEAVDVDESDKSSGEQETSSRKSSGDDLQNDFFSGKF